MIGRRVITSRVIQGFACGPTAGIGGNKRAGKEAQTETQSLLPHGPPVGLQPICDASSSQIGV